MTYRKTKFELKGEKGGNDIGNNVGCEFGSYFLFVKSHFIRNRRMSYGGLSNQQTGKRVRKEG